ncbi:hypothetical protein [Streptomyces sp. GQFP]|uniref:hypothetical protein n=1 Tax=Streptomyces sp. GQFP TaxID=2907545 RepID=UPI001F3EC640|nr:hypothetical protein [Streptomyces sp. GQFP]UIX32027.1 hypothetical protein LUX31_19390 [Streptomyces sp. GQFP]
MYKKSAFFAVVAGVAYANVMLLAGPASASGDGDLPWTGSPTSVASTLASLATASDTDPVTSPDEDLPWTR